MDKQTRTEASAEREPLFKKETLLLKLLPIIAVALVCAMPPFYLFCKNAYSVVLSDIFLPMAVFVAAGLALFFVLWAIIKNRYLAGLIASLLMFLFLNFNLARLLGDIIWWYRPVIAGLIVWVVVAVAGVTALIIISKKHRELLIALVVVLCVVLGAQVLFNTISAVPDIYARITDKQYQADPGSAEHESYKPNIYYIIMDEYAPPEMLEKYYGVDNYAFYDYLESLGFNVAHHSYNNSFMTMQVLTDNFSLDYASTDKFLTTKEQQLVSIIHNAPLYSVLENLDYELWQASSMPYLFPLNSLIPRSEFLFQAGHAQENGTNTVETLLDNTMLYPIVDRLLYWIADGRYPLTVALEYLDDTDAYVSEGNTFILSYICAPHTPFVYDADGNINDFDQWANWTDTKYYVGQYEYMTERISAVLEKIIAADPDCIIILQSDHSVRNIEIRPMRQDFEIDENDQRNFFSALYYHGEIVDIEGMSAVNVMRYVVSSVGGDYPQLDNPTYDERLSN